ncbi:TRAP transporter small permease subunit [Leisingera sp. S232]|uniref:TRAP transporter small permease subunit n=1 Tax=Leisingera sp. S232 TaxID=3415132 RepID=UPI003C7D284C
MLAAALLIGSDILLRVVFNKAIDGADELARFALAIATTWSLGGALLDRTHIRVDTAYVRFPARMQLTVDIAALIAFLAVFAVVTLFGFELVIQSLQTSSRSTSALQIPMVYPQAIWLGGLIMLLFSGLVLLACCLALIAKGDCKAASALAGIKSAEEEVQEEVELQHTETPQTSKGHQP